MLWCKYWLETRWVFLVAVVLAVLPLPFNPEARHQLPELEKLLSLIGLYWIFAAAILAGAGIRTRAGLRNKGLYGSMYYLLSMPVNRMRLFLSRVSLGFLELAGTIVIVCLAIWFSLPVLRANAHPAEMLRYALVALACTSAFYFLAVFVASLIDDEMGKTVATVAIAGILEWIGRLTGFSSFGLVRAAVSASPLRAVIPWNAIVLSAVLSAVLTVVALMIVQRREYSA